jgi:hypothetical protein
LGGIGTPAAVSLGSIGASFGINSTQSSSTTGSANNSAATSGVGTGGNSGSNTSGAANSASAGGTAGANGLGAGTALGGNGIGVSPTRTRTHQAAGTRVTRVTASDVLSSEIQYLCSNLIRAGLARTGTSGPAGTTSIASAQAAGRGGAAITGTPAARSIPAGARALEGHSICHREYAMAQHVTLPAVRRIARNFLSLGATSAPEIAAVQSPSLSMENHLVFGTHPHVAQAVQPTPSGNDSDRVDQNDFRIG